MLKAGVLDAGFYFSETMKLREKFILKRKISFHITRPYKNI